MSKVLLISSNTTIDPYPVYPAGMGIIASALTLAGHDVRQFDMLAAEDTEGDLRQTITDFSPHYVGISIRNIDTVDSCAATNEWFLSSDLAITRIVREATEAPVILGGPAFSIMPDEILQYLGADYGITGEGEHAVCNLVAALDEGKTVPVISHNGATHRAGESAAWSPLRDDDLVRFYTRKTGMIGVQTKRGCPHKCTYCTYPAIEGDSIRYRPADDVADEIERLRTDYGVDKIYFTDSVFNDDDGAYLEIADTIVRRGIQIKWTGFFRPEPIGKDEMALLKRSGLYAVEAGSDAASDETLAGINKQFTFDDVHTFNERCVEARIPCAHYIIFGGPDETEETLRKGFHNIGMLRNSMVFAFSGIRVLPGTGLCSRAIEDGIVNEGESLLKSVYYFSPAVDPLEMNRALADLFHGHINRVFPPSKGLAMVRRMNKHGRYGLLWDRLVNFS